MNFLPKPIRTEEYTYYSTSSLDELRAAMQRILGKSNRGSFGFNISNGFISNDVFKVTRQLSANNAGWNIITLGGRIYEDEFKRTTVTFTIKPAQALSFLFFIPFLFAICNCLISLRAIDYGHVTLKMVIMPFFFPLVVLVLAHIIKQGIRKTFIKTFQLQEII